MKPFDRFTALVLGDELLQEEDEEDGHVGVEREVEGGELLEVLGAGGGRPHAGHQPLHPPRQVHPQPVPGQWWPLGLQTKFSQSWRRPHYQGVREKAQVFETLNFFGKGLTQIETDVQLL